MAHVHAARQSQKLCGFRRYGQQSGGFSWIVYGFKTNTINGNRTVPNHKFFAASFTGNGTKESGVAAQVDGDIAPPNEKPEVEEKEVEAKETVFVQPKHFGMPFEEFVKSKRKLRARQRVAGLPFALLGLGTSSVVSAYMFPDMFDATPENVQLIMGMDPLIFCGICGVVSCGIGYVAGSSLFSVFNRILNKDMSRKMDERERDFLGRIQAHRFADFSKFEDDYYGESIRTLSDYRQWLRTQQKKKTAAAKFIKEKEEQPS